MKIYQKIYQMEYLVKKAIETDDARKKQELLLKMGSVLELKMPQVEEFNQDPIRQLY